PPTIVAAAYDGATSLSIEVAVPTASFPSAPDVDIYLNLAPTGGPNRREFLGSGTLVVDPVNASSATTYGHVTIQLAGPIPDIAYGLFSQNPTQLVATTTFSTTG